MFVDAISREQTVLVPDCVAYQLQILATVNSEPNLRRCGGGLPICHAPYTLLAVSAANGDDCVQQRSPNNSLTQIKRPPKSVASLESQAILRPVAAKLALQILFKAGTLSLFLESENSVGCSAVPFPRDK